MCANTTLSCFDAGSVNPLLCGYLTLNFCIFLWTVWCCEILLGYCNICMDSVHLLLFLKSVSFYLGLPLSKTTFIFVFFGYVLFLFRFSVKGTVSMSWFIYDISVELTACIFASLSSSLFLHCSSHLQVTWAFIIATLWFLTVLYTCWYYCGLYYRCTTFWLDFKMLQNWQHSNILYFDSLTIHLTGNYKHWSLWWSKLKWIAN